MKKGFTLIELLAVILILGIISLIAIPTVNNILKESRRGAFQSTLTNLEKAIEEQCTVEQIKNIDINNTYTITDGKISPNVEIKGDLPDGFIEVNKNCEVSFILGNNNFIGTKNYNDEIIINEGSINNYVYTESILNGTDPVLSNDLIPVTIKDDGTVKRASLKSKWYSYSEKKWANAVILTPTGKVEDDGTILEDSIESYFVWIPRYKYKLFDMGNYNSVIEEEPTNKYEKTIEIVFENKNTSVSVGTEVGQYHSHPAFQSFDTNGLWVGKFETSGTTNSLQIKPNKQSLRETNIKTMFETAYNYKRDNDSHMMKNTEWGAVTYLSHSKYGINSEVNINNNSDYLTGYSATSSSDQTKYLGDFGTDSSVTLPYNTETGYLASTTGNITGIYDMNGGSQEYMASYKSVHENDGFESDPISIYGNKYFDKYPSDTGSTSYNNRILGDAVGEVGPFYKYADGDGRKRPHSSWYKDYSMFLYYTWVTRGGIYYDGSSGGLFNVGGEHGGVMSNITMRLVLIN